MHQPLIRQAIHKGLVFSHTSNFVRRTFATSKMVQIKVMEKKFRKFFLCFFFLSHLVSYWSAVTMMIYMCYSRHYVTKLKVFVINLVVCLYCDRSDNVFEKRFLYECAVPHYNFHALNSNRLTLFHRKAIKFPVSTCTKIHPVIKWILLNYVPERRS